MLYASADSKTNIVSIDSTSMNVIDNAPAFTLLKIAKSNSFDIFSFVCQDTTSISLCVPLYCFYYLLVCPLFTTINFL